MKLTAACFVALSAFAQTKQPDLCVPPPSGTAPSLPAKIMEGQGRVHFPITTSNPQAQAFFDQGVAQLHSFWATEAERSFRQAAELDPDAPMPWWGVAMVSAGDYRPRFQAEMYAKVFGAANPLRSGGRTIEAAIKAKQLATVPGKVTPLEKMYIDAVAARRNAESKDPDGDYIQGLRAIVAQYPDEVEAKLYLALHLMHGFTLPDKQPREGSMEAVGILRDLLQKAPDHPGVHHYVIHGFEGATFAKEAWPSCKRYPELTPNIPHALHMPGHIYAQTGRWDDAVDSFESAATSERGYMHADKLYGAGHHGHNVHFLATSYSFRGDYDKAEQAAGELLALGENPREAGNLDGFFSPYRQGWFAMLRTLVQGQRWDKILDGKTLPLYDKPREQAWRHWAMSQAYAAQGNLELAKVESKLMDSSLREYKAKVKMPIPEVLDVARIELDGNLKIAEGKKDEGLRKLSDAADREVHLAYTEPPFYPRPVLEVLGEAAMKSGKTDQAVAAFKRALEQYPSSHRAQIGLQAAAQQGTVAGN